MNESKLSNVTKEELEKLIFGEKLSYEEIGRRYEVSGSAIKKKAKKLMNTKAGKIAGGVALASGAMIGAKKLYDHKKK
jgi:hypothetical protein